MKEYTPSKDTFIAGTLDQYAALTSLVTIASSRKTTSSTTAAVDKVEHYLARHIYESLTKGGNPIASVLENNVLNFESSVHANDSTFDVLRGVAIMQADSQYTRVLSELGEVSEQSAELLAMNTIVDKVNQQTQLYCAQVTMATCHDVMKGSPLTSELVEQHTQEKVVDVLEQTRKLQKELSVEILVLNNLKEETLADMSHIEFQQQFHHELKNISPMDSMALNQFQTKVVQSGVDAPAQLSALRIACAEMTTKHDLSWKLDLPKTNSDVYAILQRENIPFTSQSYKAELDKMSTRIDTGIEQYLEQLNASRPEQQPANNLSELLKRADIGPSM
ncbi:hypothetical protein KW429_11490 [Vibrio fluvialis]|nr:hypothetical protein [Vibrio fluvialis]